MPDVEGRAGQSALWFPGVVPGLSPDISCWLPIQLNGFPPKNRHSSRMRFPNTLVRSALSAAVVLNSFSVLAAEDWKPLFNGKNLDGWVQRGGKATYRVDGDSVVGTTAPNTPNTFLCTGQDYGDFELQLQFKVDSSMNSGVQFRSVWSEESLVYEFKGKEHRVRAGVVHGYQYEIDPSDRKWTAGVYDESRRGWLFDLKQKPEAGEAFKKDEWNQLQIVVRGDHIQTWINGVSAADFHDALTLKGFIALQVHGVGERKEPMEIRWRDIKIKALDPVTKKD